MGELVLELYWYLLKKNNMNIYFQAVLMIIFIYIIIQSTFLKANSEKENLYILF